MDDDIKKIYYNYMNNKKFHVDDYKAMSKLVRDSDGIDTPLVEALHDAWKQTETKRTCFDCMKHRFIAVLTFIAPKINGD